MINTSHTEPSEFQIQSLPKEQWQKHEIVFRYETTHFYDAHITQNEQGFCASFLKKPFPTPVKKEFKSELFTDYWEGSQAFGVFLEKNLIACLEIWKEDWSNRLRITEIWVDETHRRKGIGKKFMTLAKEKAKELNCRAIILETQSCNEKAINFYITQGFTFFGFDKSCYSNKDIENCEVRLELGLYL